LYDHSFINILFYLPFDLHHTYLKSCAGLGANVWLSTYPIIHFFHLVSNVFSTTLRFGSAFPICSSIYVCPFPLYFLEAFRHKDLTIISSESSTLYGDPLGGMLFALTHLHALYPTTISHPTCVFASLEDDMHIVDLALNVLFVFLWLQEEFGTIGLSM
jgi:hypothetical protein